MIIQNFNLSENSKNSIGINKEERTYNNKTFKMLNNKRKNLDSQFKNYLKEKDLLSNYIIKSIKLDLNQNTKFKIHKNNLDLFFNQSKDKKYHKEIYNTKIYDIINPYNLVEQKFIKPKYISKEIRSSFNLEKERLKERENSIMSNKFYDKNKKISFELAPKDHKFNKISNAKILNDAIKSHCLIVKLKNEEDDFKKILLLTADFTVNELKSLIQFIYKVVNGIIIDNLNLYYKNKYYLEIPIEDDDKTMKELAGEMHSESELEIFIQTQY